ncbi:unnamed protein product [Knipowitschia caucasica]
MDSTPAPASTTSAAPGPGSRFQGDGVRYKAKLIGIDHVTSGDAGKSCVDSMMKLKGFEAAFRKQGRHKQRVWLKIFSGGLRILDEKTAAEMYVHEQHDISALTRDDSDPRALAYVHKHTDNFYLFYLRMANLAEPVLNDIREVCRDQQQNQGSVPDPPTEAPQISALLVVDEASTRTHEEPALENVFSPRPDGKPASSELMEVFAVPLGDPIEPSVCPSAVALSEPDPEPPRPALSNSQILSMFTPPALYPPPGWAPPGMVAPQWAGPVAPWPNQTAAWPSAPPTPVTSAATVSASAAAEAQRPLLM